MRTITYAALFFCSTALLGCFVSRKETVREVPVTTRTTEHRSSTETVPATTQGEVRKHTTVDTTY
jgi:hypothetical protein